MKIYEDTNKSHNAKCDTCDAALSHGERYVRVESGSSRTFSSRFVCDKCALVGLKQFVDVLRSMSVHEAHSVVGAIASTRRRSVDRGDER